MGIEVRTPGDGAELAAMLKLMAQSFTSDSDPAGPYVDQVGVENFRIAWQDGRLVGCLAIFWMGHYLGGRSVPVCGVAAVGVDPSVRGTGVGRRLMLAVLREARERGVPTSSLFSSTQGPYRRVGFEQAGHRNGMRVNLRELRPRGRALQLTPIDPADDAPLRPLYTRWAQQRAGLLDRNEGIWKRVHQGEHTYGVLFGDPADPEGYAVWSQVKHGTGFYDLHVRDRVALTPAAEQSMWNLLADHRSMALSATLIAPADEAWMLHPAEWRSLTPTRYEPWMMRICDVKGAFEARGWTADGGLEIELSDEDLPENEGRWRIEVSDGRAAVSRGGSGAMKLDRRALASVFTGMYRPSDLARNGFVDGERRDLAAADALFAGPRPWVLDHF